MVRPDKWCRIYRTWNGWWCWFCLRIDRPRKQVYILREEKLLPLVLLVFELLILCTAMQCNAFALYRSQNEMKMEKKKKKWKCVLVFKPLFIYERGKTANYDERDFELVLSPILPLLFFFNYIHVLFKHLFICLFNNMGMFLLKSIIIFYLKVEINLFAWLKTFNLLNNNLTDN